MKTSLSLDSILRILFVIVVIPTHLLLFLHQLHLWSSSSHQHADVSIASDLHSHHITANHHNTAANLNSMETFVARGQHLLLDLYQVEADLLNNKEALLSSMLKFVQLMDMSVMGYVAEQLQPQGVSITIALKESHFTVHTYPEVGIAFVDLFTCGDTQLLAYKSQLALTFGANFLDTRNTKWSLIPRGVKHSYELNDLNMDLSFLQSEKRLVYSGSSSLQKIDIWAIKGKDSWNDRLFGIKHDVEKSKAWSKALYMDGTLQSNTIDEYKYHESLVHPALLSHLNGARRVAIVGGGEGGTLREVLKYKTVEYVEMIEIDKGIIQTARSFLPELHNCSFLLKSSSNKNQTTTFSCFDEPRVHLILADAMIYFDQRNEDRKGIGCNNHQRKTSSRRLRGVQKKRLYSKRKPFQKRKQQQEKLHKLQSISAEVDDDGFDVIIMDLFDPEDKRQDLVKALYSKKTLSKIACSLRKDGIIVTQLGESVVAVDTAFHNEQRNFNTMKLNILQNFANLLNDEQSIPSQLFVYNTYIDSFSAEWSFAILFTTRNGPTNFFHNGARIEMTLRHRILPSALPLKYIDGTVIETFNKLPREWQDAYCFQSDHPAICDLFNLPSQEDHSNNEEDIEPMVILQHSTMSTDIGEANRWETVAAVDIPKWMDLGLYDAATSIVMSLEEYNLLDEFVEVTKSKEYAGYLDMINRYAYECNDVNGQYIYVSLNSKNTFVNHGCNSSVVNIGSIDFPEQVFESIDEDDDDDDDYDEIDDFNLVIQRYPRQYCAMSLALRDIKRGEQILEDYGLFGDSWKPPASWCGSN